MKKNLTILLFILICSIYSHAQSTILPQEELILSDEVKEMINKINYYKDLLRYDSTDQSIIENIHYEMGAYMDTEGEDIAKKRLYSSYAYFLAKNGYLEEAIYYFDLAFQNKYLFDNFFETRYMKDYFAKDPVLYQKKCADYREKRITRYTPVEMTIKIKLREIFATDQMIRNYYYHLSDENEARQFMMYVDTTNILAIIELIKEYPEIEDPLSVDNMTDFVIGRHLFTAYPEFWLTYFEPIARKQLLRGEYDPQTYARTYDRCIITSGQSQFSYYGEWGNEGENENPDSVSVDRRRINLGLPMLKDKIADPNKIFITY